MNISGIYIKTWPDELALIQQKFNKISGVEVHMTTENGGLIVTAETGDTASMADTLMDMQQMEGVLSATLVYHHDEQAPYSELPAGDRQ